MKNSTVLSKFIRPPIFSDYKNLKRLVLSGIWMAIIFLLFIQSSSAQIKSPVLPEISGGAEQFLLMQKSPEKVPDWKPPQKKPTPVDEEKAITGLYSHWNAIDFDGNATNTGFYNIPPDPIGAAGPNHVVNVVNTSIEWYTKAGVQQNSQSLQSFFSSATLTFDPKVIYDQYEGRFVVVTLETLGRGDANTANDVSRIYLAVSDDSNPNGTLVFYHYQFFDRHYWFKSLG